MAHLDILLYPDKRLKQTSQPVKEFSENLKKFVRDLEKTFRSFPGCVGMEPPRWLDLKGLF